MAGGKEQFLIKVRSFFYKIEKNLPICDDWGAIDAGAPGREVAGVAVGTPIGGPAVTP